MALEEFPVSRTHQYRKVMKPLLERKRRARINKCLDDLKELMVEALQAEGESISKLEKADVLELTVNHLRKLKRQQMLQNNPALDRDRYNSGYTACANEVSRFLATVPGVDIRLGTGLMAHLGNTVNDLSSPLSVATYHTVPTAIADTGDKRSSFSPMSSDAGYNSGRESTSPPPMKIERVWRPF